MEFSVKVSRLLSLMCCFVMDFAGSHLACFQNNHAFPYVPGKNGHDVVFVLFVYQGSADLSIQDTVIHPAAEVSVKEYLFCKRC